MLKQVLTKKAQVESQQWETLKAEFCETKRKTTKNHFNAQSKFIRSSLLRDCIQT